MIKWIKENKSLVLLMVFMVTAITLMMSPAWINGEFFLGGGDIKTQWDPFYYLNRRETISSLKNLQLPFYSWTLFLGTNIWASKASYGFFDLYNVLTYPFHSDYLRVYLVLCYVKMLASALFFYRLLKYLETKDEYCLLGSLCFGLSSYGVYFTSEFGFLSFYSLLPLYFLGIEQFLKEKRKTLFILSVVLLFLTNYYLFFAVTVLTPFYFIYRYYNIHKNLKRLVQTSLLAIGYYSIGFLISGIVIVPVFFFIMQNERVGGGGISFIYENFKVYLHLLSSSLLPSQTYIYGNNIFDFASHNLKEMCFFSSSCVVMLVPQIFCNKNTVFRRSTILLYLFLFLFIFIPFLPSLLNGFSEPSFRFSMVFIFINIFVFTRILNDESEINKKVLLISFVLEAVLVYICFFVALALENETVSSYRVQFRWITIACAFTFIYWELLRKDKKTYLKYVLIIELCVYTFSFGYRTRGVDLQSYENARSVLSDYNSYGMVKGYLDGLDKENYQSFYRVYVPYESLYWSASRNMNIYYGIPGVMTYDSTYEPSFNEMKRIGNIPTIQTIDWEFSIQDPDLLNFLNVKYAFAISEDEIPFRNYIILQKNYRGGIIVAENEDYIPVGRVYSNYVWKDEYNGDPEVLTKAIITDNQEVVDMIINSDQSEREMYDVYYYNNHLEGYIACEEDGFMLISIPYDDGWKILINGEEVKKYNVSCGFIGIPVFEGTNRIDMYFVPKGFKLGAVFTGIGIIMFLIVTCKNWLKKKSLKNC